MEMEDSKLVRQVERQIEKLATIQEIPVLMEEARKFLTHFIHFFQRVSGNVIDDHYFQTLYLCETSIAKSDVAERDNSVVHKILNTILEMIHREYVRKKVVIESLSTLHQIMCNLYHLEVVQSHFMLRKKLAFLNRFFCKMEHFGMMSSIVGILYQYVSKYEPQEREKIFAEIMQDFNDPTKQLAVILQWAPETFHEQCRQYLNSIPDRKYYSLAARSAFFGDKTVIPLKKMPYISFEFNSDPSEVSFKALFVDKKMDHAMQACIEFSDIRSLEIIQDLKHPRVLCTYGKITIEGITIETYDIIINVVHNDELNELAEFVTPLLNSVKFVRKNVSPILEEPCEETVLVHEKFYNTMDFASHILLQESNEPKPTSADPGLESVTMTDTMPKNESPTTKNTVAHEHDDDKENREETTNLSQSSTTNFQPFDTKWKTNLLQHVSKSKKTEHSLVHDPYDVELMRYEEIAQRKEKLRMDTDFKRCENGRKSECAENVSKRPKYMLCSTPTKAKLRHTTLSKSFLNDELSSIGGDSSDDEKHDATYIPYSMLSKTGIRGRGNKKGSKRQSASSARILQPSKKSNAKMLPTKTSALGKGAHNGKTQICDISSSTPHVEPTKMMQAVVPMDKATTCKTIAPYTMLSEGQPQNGENKKGGELQLPPIAATRGGRKRVNSKHTTMTHTTKTTKTTTTETTEVGLATCAVSGPAEDTTMQEDTITMPPSEMVVPCHATEQVHCRALYTVEKHQEYRVHHIVNEAESFVHALSEADRRQALVYAHKIIDILTQGMNNTSIHKQ